MEADLLTVVSCAVPAEKVDAVFELLDADVFTPTSWMDNETGQCHVDVFLEDAAAAPTVARALTDAGALAGLALQPTFSKLARSNWAEGWKRYFHVEKISDRVVVRPSWESYAAQPGECVLTLDPGMSFGTGKHETTRACLRFLDRLAAEDANRAVLDMGCGTGILSIGAKLLGFREVSGFDIDPDCIQVSHENAAVNHVQIPFSVGDLSQPWPPRAIVVANILAPILLQFVKPVAASVEHSPRARLILSGILEGQYPAIRAAYEAEGFRELDTLQLGEWKSGLYGRAKEVWNSGSDCSI